MKELIIFKENDKKVLALLEGEELVEKYEEDDKDKSIEGNIYVGKVQNVISGLQSAFVNIGEKRTAFIHARDILPKIDITKEKREIEPLITELIKPGDPIIVEVKREAVDKKGPRLSTHISLSSRFIVFMPNAPFITVSQKIEEESERIRLKELVAKYLPENSGAIVRTVAAHASEEDIKNDIYATLDRWKEIQEIPVEKIPQKIYDKGGILKKTVIDLVDNNLDRIVVRDEEFIPEIQTILKEINATSKIEIDKEILAKHNLEKQLNALKSNKVYLKSGAFITIDKTEALVAIDVNSGKFIGEKVWYHLYIPRKRKASYLQKGF